MEIKKIVPLIISSILLANLISLAQPGNPYTILIYVNLYGSPVSNATVIVTELATNESRNATQTNPGIYGINLGNFGLGWHVGDNVLIEVFYEEYYAKNIIVLTDEGYSIVNISLRNNTSPVANDDYYSTNEDVKLVISAPGILANDIDADNDNLTAILLNNPSNGSLTLNSNGSFVYTPSLNYYGSDSFTYKANDGISDSNIATVYITINPTNDEPIANFNFYPENPIVGQTVYFNSTSYDIDGSIINWTWNFDNFFAYEENTTYIYSEAGKHNVTLIVKDTDGATASIVKEVIVQISDDVPPLTKIEFGLPYYYDGTKEWITSSTLITLSASDEGSGVDRTYYYIDDLPAIEYSEPFTVSAGMHTIYYYSIDKLGNVETTKSTVVYVDNIPPTSRVDEIIPYEQEEIPFNITVVEIEDHGAEI
ncbi:MAG: Ig-like domain-containing protein, partial [Candidatus Thermoplasmatota archaeon]